jgi:hypothetical protein
VKHWKLEDIDNGIIGGSQKSYVYKYQDDRPPYIASSYISYSIRERYTGFWQQNQYLNPFPQMEINKGYLIQNPGY